MSDLQHISLHEPTSRSEATSLGWPYALAALLLLLPFFAALVAAVGFAAGLPISPYHLWISAALAALATWAVAGAEGIGRRERTVVVAAGIGLVLLSLSLAHAAWDLSYDGQAYHQSSVRLLASGWNPLRHSLTPAETTHGLWLDHYVRAIELGAATVTAATGSIEAGKASGLWLLVAATVLCASTLRRAGLGRAPAAGAALIVVASPIVLSQLPTYYVDGQLALVLACAVALAWMAARGEARTAPLLLAVALALLANVKFTATVYAALILAGYALTALRGAETRRRARTGLVAALALAGTLAIGWQPLVTNALDHGHPFHPVAGPSRVDGLSGQTPRFRHRDPLRRLLESTFSASRSAHVTATLKLPVVVEPQELAAMTVPDVRVGGFGPLFALGVVLALLGAAALPWSRPGAASRAAIAVAGGLLVTALINPGAWWARFVPQLWIAVGVASVAAAAARSPARWLGLAALAALACDTGLVAACTVHHQAVTQVAAAAQGRELARRHRVVDLPRGEMESLDLRLARSGVPARYVASCSPTAPLVGTYADYCSGAPEPPPPAAAVSRP